MPTVPTSSKCSMLGCRGQRSKMNSFCADHGGKDNAEVRATDSVYQTAFWKATRMVQLTRQPMCQACLVRGKVSEAKHVDHLFPWRKVGGQSFKKNIFQSLCAECHSYKTGQEKHGNVLHFTTDGIKEYKVEQYKQVVFSADEFNALGFIN